MDELESPGDNDLREARGAALNYLARREHGCRELELKLIRRGISASAAASVVARLQDENLVSDTRYAEAFVRSKVSRLFGPQRIRAELRQRDLPDSLIEQALAAHADEWQPMADAWARKRAAAVLDRREQARIYRSGINRGFSHEHMMRALERLKIQD